MKPPAFAYRRPTSVDEALDELARTGSDAVVLAGGQSLIPLMSLRLARPEVVVDINRLPDLANVRISDSAIEVDALVRARDLERDANVRASLPVLFEALRNIAHPQIRNRTTIGGNVSHADPSSELPAVLAALDGWVRLRSVNGVREVPWHEYFLSVFLTSKAPDELLTQVVFPRNSGWEFTFNEIARRQGDYPLAGLCSGVRVEDGRIAEARLAAIAVSDRPVRLTSAENALVGVAADDMRAVRDACAEAAEGLVPTEDLHGTSAHRKGLLVTLARRSMADLLSRGAA